MRFISRLSFTSLILMLLGAGVVSAQSINFSLFVTVNGNSGTVANGGDVLINGQVGTQTTATVVATYTGPTQATIAKKPQILGSSSLTVVTVPDNLTYPLVLGLGQTFTFVVTYQPSNTTIANAQVEVQYTEPGTTTGTVPGAILLQFTGTAPAFTLSYILQADNNVIPLAPGGTIAFLPPTQINTTAQAQLNITDTGSGQGIITGIVLLSGGPVFKLSGTPLFPYTATPNTNTANLPIIISYTPTAVENDTGQIQITYQGGSTATVNLAGNGATSSYTYSYLSGNDVNSRASEGYHHSSVRPLGKRGNNPVHQQCHSNGDEQRKRQWHHQFGQLVWAIRSYRRSPDSPHAEAGRHGKLYDYVHPDANRSPNR